MEGDTIDDLDFSGSQMTMTSSIIMTQKTVTIGEDGVPEVTSETTSEKVITQTLNDEDMMAAGGDLLDLNLQAPRDEVTDVITRGDVKQQDDLEPQTDDLEPQSDDLVPQTDDLVNQNADLLNQSDDLINQNDLLNQSGVSEQSADLLDQSGDQLSKSTASEGVDLLNQSDDLINQNVDLLNQSNDQLTQSGASDSDLQNQSDDLINQNADLLNKSFTSEQSDDLLNKSGASNQSDDLINQNAGNDLDLLNKSAASDQMDDLYNQNQIQLNVSSDGLTQSSASDQIGDLLNKSANSDLLDQSTDDFATSTDALYQRGKDLDNVPVLTSSAIEQVTAGGVDMKVLSKDLLSSSMDEQVLKPMRGHIYTPQQCNPKPGILPKAGLGSLELKKGSFLR